MKLYGAYLASREERRGLKLYSVKIYWILFILETQQDLTPIHLAALMHCQNTICKSVKAVKEN